MSRTSKLTVAAAGLGVVAAGAVAVPALAAPGDSTPAVGATASPSASSTDDSSSSDVRQGGPRVALRLFGASAADVAKAAGATEQQLSDGLRSGKTLTEIAAAHDVDKATLVQRLGALADQEAATIVDRKRGDAPAGTDSKQTRVSPLADVLADLVKKGTITQAQADAITKAMQDKRGGTPGGGPGGRHAGGGLLGDNAKELASTLKVSESELSTQLAAGKSLAEIGAAGGVSRQTVIDKVATLLKADLPTLVDQKPPTRIGRGGPEDLPNLPGGPGARSGGQRSGGDQGESSGSEQGSTQQGETDSSGTGAPDAPADAQAPSFT